MAKKQGSQPGHTGSKIGLPDFDRWRLYPTPRFCPTTPFSCRIQSHFSWQTNQVKSAHQHGLFIQEWTSSDAAQIHPSTLFPTKKRRVSISRGRLVFAGFRFDWNVVKKT